MVRTIQYINVHSANLPYLTSYHESEKEASNVLTKLARTGSQQKPNSSRRHHIRHQLADIQSLLENGKGAIRNI
jgi:hypothetical protein